MKYKVKKDGIHPITKQPISKGEIVNIFHEIGNKHCEGDDPLLQITKRIDPKTAIALEYQIRQDEELEEIEENTNEIQEDFFK